MEYFWGDFCCFVVVSMFIITVYYCPVFFYPVSNMMPCADTTRMSYINDIDTHMLTSVYLCIYIYKVIMIHVCKKKHFGSLFIKK